jgi:hypothetical protein
MPPASDAGMLVCKRSCANAHVQMCGSRARIADRRTIAGSATQAGASTEIAISSEQRPWTIPAICRALAHTDPISLPESELGCFHHTGYSYLC